MFPEQIGPFTTLSETAAAAVGAGVILGGFAAGIRGLAAGRRRADVEDRAFFGGYIGGAIGALIAILDLCLRYSVLK